MKIIPFFMVLVVVVSYIVMSTNPLQRSPERIRENLLELTPIGMDKTQSIEILNTYKAINTWVRLDVGHLRGVSMPLDLGVPGSTIGKTSARVILGRYRSGIAWTAIEAHWAFDENAELIDIFVIKPASLASHRYWIQLRN